MPERRNTPSSTATWMPAPAFEPAASADQGATKGGSPLWTWGTQKLLVIPYNHAIVSGHALEVEVVKQFRSGHFFSRITEACAVCEYATDLCWAEFFAQLVCSYGAVHLSQFLLMRLLCRPWLEQK